jgi:metal-dependent HD superfamily phosphatase/phosphodiesterase
MHIVANIALRLTRLLADREVEFSLVKNYGALYGFTQNDVEVVVVLASLLHDVGMSIHRADHEQYSLFVAQPKIDDLLADLYPTAARTILRSEILHAIISHRADGRPITVEAGVVRVADALDMAEGRSRIPIQAGHLNIHSVSAAAIEKVEIGPGEERPVRIRILMNNSAGIFQVDELMKDKLRGSGIDSLVEVEAAVTGEAEKRLIHALKI